MERWLGLIAETINPSEQTIAGMAVVDETRFQALPAWLATTRAYHAQAIGDAPGTVKYVKQALDLLPEDDQCNRAAVTGLFRLARRTRAI